jgi:hypothetical protein
MTRGVSMLLDVGRYGINAEVCWKIPLRRGWKDTTRIKSHLNETGLDNEMWMKLAQDYVQWQTLLLTVLNL